MLSGTGLQAPPVDVHVFTCHHEKLESLTAKDNDQV